MKRSLIAATVGGIIIFLWQFASWGVLNLHRPSSQYLPNQDSVMSYLSTNLPGEGGYMIPNLPDDAKWEDHEKAMETMKGKPWVTIQYHNSLNTDMATPMIRGFLSNVIMLLLFIWILNKLQLQSFSNIFTSSVLLGLIVFINQPYTGHIWYKFFDIWAYLLDCFGSWTLCGLWLGWWLSRRSI